MARRMIHRAALALGALALAASAAAQTRDASPDVQLFGREMQPGATFGRVLSRVEKMFAELNTGGDTLNADDVAVHELILGGAFRAAAAANIIYMDFDRDGFVTEDEVDRATLYRYRSRLDDHNLDIARTMRRELERVLKLDRDGDGRVSWEEAFSVPESGKSRDAGMTRPSRQLQLALTFDADGDGEVTLQEFRAVAEAMYRNIDTNGDGALSAEEVGGRTGAEVEAALRAQDAACAMPRASTEAEVVLIGLYGTEALSSVAVGSQDEVTNTAGLIIEPGDKPLYIVAVSHQAIIWQVTGAVERVENLVLGSNVSIERDGTKLPLVGATGLPADRVTTLGRFDCLRYFDEAQSIAATTAATKVRIGTGKEPTAIIASHKMSEVAVPSGEIVVLRPNRYEPSTMPKRDGKYVSSYHPGGVIDVDANAVVSSLPAAPYEVLPQEAGVRQLVEEGALTLNKSREYLIHRKIRYPAGLNGAHAVTFLVLRGVPVPDGDPGHSTVVSEETGETLSSPDKRR